MTDIICVTIVAMSGNMQSWNAWNSDCPAMSHNDTLIPSLSMAPTSIPRVRPCVANRALIHLSLLRVPYMERMVDIRVLFPALIKSRTASVSD